MGGGGVASLCLYPRIHFIEKISEFRYHRYISIKAVRPPFICNNKGDVVERLSAIAAANSQPQHEQSERSFCKREQQYYFRGK